MCLHVFAMLPHLHDHFFFTCTLMGIPMSILWQNFILIDTYFVSVLSCRSFILVIEEWVQCFFIVFARRQTVESSLAVWIFTISAHIPRFPSHTLVEQHRQLWSNTVTNIAKVLVFLLYIFSGQMLWTLLWGSQPGNSSQSQTRARTIPVSRNITTIKAISTVVSIPIRYVYNWITYHFSDRKHNIS